MQESCPFSKVRASAVIYVVIDTSTFVKTWTHSAPGSEIGTLTMLAELVDNGTICILLPEVVELEIQKNWRSFAFDVKKGVSDLKLKVDVPLKQEKSVWNEIEAIRTAITRFWSDWETQFLTECEERYRLLREFLDSARVTKIAFTPEIMFHGKRLMISGAMNKSERGDQDAFIVQSVIQQLQDAHSPHDYLYFCTQNVKDFAVSTDARVTALRLGVREKLPKSSFFTDLTSLVAAAREHIPPDEPDPSKVQDAEDRETARQTEDPEVLIKQFKAALDEFQVLVNNYTRIQELTALANVGKGAEMIRAAILTAKPVDADANLWEAVLKVGPYGK